MKIQSNWSITIAKSIAFIQENCFPSIFLYLKKAWLPWTRAIHVFLFAQPILRRNCNCFTSIKANSSKFPVYLHIITAWPKISTKSNEEIEKQKKIQRICANKNQRPFELGHTCINHSELINHCHHSSKFLKPKKDTFFLLDFRINPYHTFWTEPIITISDTLSRNRTCAFFNLPIGSAFLSQIWKSKLYLKLPTLNKFEHKSHKLNLAKQIEKTNLEIPRW